MNLSFKGIYYTEVLEIVHMGEASNEACSIENPENTGMAFSATLTQNMAY